MRRAPLIALATAVLAVVVLAGLLQARRDDGGDTAAKPPSRAEAARLLRGSPPALAGLHAQSATLLEGGAGALERRLRALRGHPVVVNQWGSWCPPCRVEFPAFQRASARYGTRVAFLGIDVDDPRPAARRFLDAHPVSFPSYVDPRYRIAAAIHLPQSSPVTVIYDAQGRQAYLHPGGYASQAELDRDVERYALGTS